MDNNIEYNQHLQQFYSQFFKDFYITNKIAPSEEELKKVFIEYTTILNTNIANTLLAKTRIKSKTYTELMDNMPSLYWKTTEGEEELKELNNKTVSTVLHRIIEAGKGGPLHHDTLVKAWKEVIDVIMINTLHNSNSYNNALSKFNENLLSFITEDGNSEIKIQLVTESSYKDALKDIVEKSKSLLSQTSLLNVFKDLQSINELINNNNYIYRSVNNSMLK